MRALTILFAALALSLGIVSSAGAADKGGKRITNTQLDETPGKSSWTGSYIGLHAGLSATSTDVGGGALELTGNGTQAGVIAGYDHQWGKIVAGIWARYTWSDIQASFGPVNTTLKGSWAGGGRLGYLVTNNLLAYVHGGLTQVEASSNVVAMPTFDGKVLGGGFEAMIADNFSLRLEYEAMLLDKETVSGVGFEPDSHTVRLVGTWRFNLPSMPAFNQ